MELVTDKDIDKCIDTVLCRLNPEAGIKELYPSQRKILHKFCKGVDIILTGKFM